MTSWSLTVLHAPAKAPSPLRKWPIWSCSRPEHRRDDLKPAVRVFHALVKAGIPKAKLAFALNHIGTPTEEAEARAYIAEAGYTVLDGCLLERPAYRRAQNTGRAVTETSFHQLNTKADALIQALIDRVGNAHG